MKYDKTSLHKIRIKTISVVSGIGLDWLRRKCIRHYQLVRIDSKINLHKNIKYDNGRLDYRREIMLYGCHRFIKLYIDLCTVPLI